MGISLTDIKHPSYKTSNLCRPAGQQAPAVNNTALYTYNSAKRLALKLNSVLTTFKKKNASYASPIQMWVFFIFFFI